MLLEISSEVDAELNKRIQLCEYGLKYQLISSKSTCFEFLSPIMLLRECTKTPAPAVIILKTSKSSLLRRYGVVHYSTQVYREDHFCVPTE